jgi:hypothetical protein
LGVIIAFNRLGGNSFFGDEFHGRTEEVVKQSPFLSIEVVEQRDYGRVV